MARLKSEYSNIAGLNRALRELPKEATVKLREASMDIASTVASEAAGRARNVGGVAQLVAGSIKGTRDRVPAIRMGSRSPLPGNRGPNRKRQTVGDVIFGAEYGGGRRVKTGTSGGTTQFATWRGSGTGAGYFLWPAVRANSSDIQERYSQALLDALRAIG